MNPKCSWPRGHATKDCWFEGGTSAHQAPEWWREKQAKRTSKIGMSAKANITKEAKGSDETVSVSVKLDTPLGGHFQDGYDLYPSIYVDENNASISEKWSGNWDELTTTLGLTNSLKTPELSGEEICTTMCIHPPYCIDSGVLCHHSPRRISLTFGQHPLYLDGDPYI